MVNKNGSTSLIECQLSLEQLESMDQWFEMFYFFEELDPSSITGAEAMRNYKLLLSLFMFIPSFNNNVKMIFYLYQSLIFTAEILCKHLLSKIQISKIRC